MSAPILPSPLGLEVLAEVAWVGCSHFEPKRWSELCWKLIESGNVTPTVSQLANEATIMSPSAFEEAVTLAIAELGMVRFRDIHEADLVWKACHVLPALGHSEILEETVRSLVADAVRTGTDLDVLVGLGTLFEGMKLGPDDLDMADLRREGFIGEHCARWARLNGPRIAPHFEAVRRIFG